MLTPLNKFVHIMSTPCSSTDDVTKSEVERREERNEPILFSFISPCLYTFTHTHTHTETSNGALLAEAAQMIAASKWGPVRKKLLSWRLSTFAV